MRENIQAPLHRIDSVIFDLDGTLWDASATCTNAWNETFAQAGLGEHTVKQETVRSFSGLRIDRVFQDYFSFVADTQQADILYRYKDREAALMRQLGGELYPHVKEVLCALRRSYKLFIVSNCLEGYIENFIRFSGLENVFTDFACAGNTGLSKEENIRLLVKRNNASAAVYIGDTGWDYEAAIGNHMPFVFASYGFGKAPDAVYTIDDFRDLLSLLYENNTSYPGG